MIQKRRKIDQKISLNKKDFKQEKESNAVS